MKPSLSTNTRKLTKLKITKTSSNYFVCVDESLVKYAKNRIKNNPRAEENKLKPNKLFMSLS